MPWVTMVETKDDLMVILKFIKVVTYAHSYDYAANNILQLNSIETTVKDGA